MEADSPILIELNSDLQALGQICENEITDDHPIVTSFCKTLESVFRHGFVKDYKESNEFFNVILNLYDQQNTIGSKHYNKAQIAIEYSTTYSCAYNYSAGAKGCSGTLPVVILKSIEFICSVKNLYSSKGRGKYLTHND